MIALNIKVLQLYLINDYLVGSVNACFQSSSENNIKSVILFYSITISDWTLFDLFYKENLAKAKE